MSEQRCGNCAWWADPRRVEGTSDIIGICMAPVPSCAVQDGYGPGMYDFEGADCPCHKPKEGKADEK